MMDWQDLKQAHNDSRPLEMEELVCIDCGLIETPSCTNRMEGRGNKKNPTYMVIGQNPGQVEDRKGKVFVGPTGKLLIEELKPIGFNGENTYLTNALKCYTDNDKVIGGEEVKACKKYLLAEIELLKPKVIILLGNRAMQALTGRESGITKVRGRIFELLGAQCVPTYHPSHILRNGGPEEFPEMELFRKDLSNAFQLGIDPDLDKLRRSDYRLETVTTFARAKKILKYLETCEEIVSFDIETHRGMPWQDGAKLCTVGYCWRDDYAVCIPLYKDDSKIPENRRDKLMDLVRHMHAERARRGLKIEAYSAVMDMMYPHAVHDFPLGNLGFDAMLAKHLLAEHISKPDLKQLAWDVDCGGYELALEKYKELHPEEADPNKGGSYANIPLSILGPYNAMDALVERRLRKAYWGSLVSQDLVWLLENVSLRAVKPILRMELNGVHIDRELLDEISKTYPVRIANQLAAMRQHPDVKTYEEAKAKELQDAWEEVEASRLREGKRPRTKKDFTKEDKAVYRCTPHQNVELFYGEEFLKLTCTTFTDKNRPSFNKAARDALMGEHPLVKEVAEHSHLKKFQGYIKGFVENTGPDDIFHPFFDLTGTVTGRCTSDIQQLPRTTTNADIRRLITSRFKDGYIVEADYDQAELRMWQICSGDDALKEIYDNDEDAHSKAACWAYDVMYEPFMKFLKYGKKSLWVYLRSAMKSAISFGLTFGRSAPALAKEFGWPLEEAEEFIARYFSIFDEVEAQIEKYKRECMRTGLLVNKFGRRRRLLEAKTTQYSSGDKLPTQIARALRQGINFPIQSLAHDFLLMAQARIDESFETNKVRSKMIGEVHDSVVFDVRKDELDKVAEYIRAGFEDFDFDWLTVPLKVEIKYGPSLGELELYDMSRLRS